MTTPSATIRPIFKPVPGGVIAVPDFTLQFVPPSGVALSTAERASMLAAIQQGMTSVSVQGAAFGNEERVGIWLHSFSPVTWQKSLQLLPPLTTPATFSYSIGFDVVSSLTNQYIWTNLAAPIAKSGQFLGDQIYVAPPDGVVTEIDGAYIALAGIEDITWQYLITDQLSITQQHVDCQTTVATSTNELDQIWSDIVGLLTGAELGLIPVVGKYLSGVVPKWMQPPANLNMPANTPVGCGRLASSMFPSVVPMSGFSQLNLVYNTIAQPSDANWTGVIGASGTCVLLEGVGPTLLPSALVGRRDVVTH